MRQKLETPWGPEQCRHEYAPDLILISTAGHGGFWCGPARWAEIRREMPFEPWAGAPWLEEDCEAVVPTLLWPELFDAYAVLCCVRMAPNLGERYASVAAWVQGPKGAAVRAIAEKYLAEHRGEWERQSLGSSDRGWRVDFEQIGTGKRRTLEFKDYPEKPVYREEEFTALIVEAKPVPVPVPFRESECGGVFDGNQVWSDTELGGAPGF